MLVGDKLRDARCVVALLDSFKDEKQLIVGEMSRFWFAGLGWDLSRLVLGA